MTDFKKTYRAALSKESLSEEFKKETLRMIGAEDTDTRNKIHFKKLAVIPVAAVLVIAACVTALGLYKGYPFAVGGASGHVYVDGVKLVSDTVFEQIGTNINQKITNGNMEILVKDIICDDVSFYINFDLQTLDGSPLQENSEFRKSLLSAQSLEAYIECEGTKYPLHTNRLDKAAVPNQASFEAAYNGVKTNSAQNPALKPEGKQLKLILGNFVDTVLTHQSIGFKFNNLAEVYNSVEHIPDSAYTKVQAGTLQNDTGDDVYTFPLGTQGLSFSDKYPNSYIDSIGIHSLGYDERKVLYIGIVTDKNQPTPDFAFKNISTGDVFEATSVYSLEQEGRITLALSLNADISFGFNRTDIKPEDLKNYIIVCNRSREKISRTKGLCNAVFTVDKVGLGKVFTLNKKITVMNEEWQIASIRLTPLNLYIEGKGSDIKLEYEHDKAYFIMNNGEKLYINSDIDGLLGETIDLRLALGTVVNPNEVSSLHIWGNDIEL
ncbi:MAG: DUF4179 domain-containing protein [Oscillospiraceae bacterium]|jgi:hypothetical protein|nr:DUF4179 domain-containing protein [Oscillospiraceae bacterium]